MVTTGGADETGYEEREDETDEWKWDGRRDREQDGVGRGVISFR